MLEELQAVLETPLADLMVAEDERAHVEELTRVAVASPAMGRLREVVAFIGSGRPATQAGNLKAPDLVALSARLATGERVPARIRTIDDLPETAHSFRWAAAAELLERKGTKIVAGPLASQLDRDPLAAWLSVATTLLEQGVIGGFRPGWHKNYVELLDVNVGGLLVGMVESGGHAPLAAIEDAAWEMVSTTCGYDPDDDAERAHVVRLVLTMVAQLADVGIMERHGDTVELTGPGSTMAAVTAVFSEGGDGGIDLADADAESVLLSCSELSPEETRAGLAAWVQARPAKTAAEELCAAILDDPDLLGPGLEALSMLDPSVARPAARRLQSHPGYRPIVSEWLRDSAPGSRKRPPR